MSLEDDYKLALRLQKKFDKEEKKNRTAKSDLEVIKHVKPKSNISNVKPLVSSKTVSLTDSSLEYSDPNPDIHALFLHFNEVFFWGKLLAVEVRWSPRMTSCAGICCYEGRGRLCSIRLSLPLLKLRPRKDLVETLLHEMIHAFLFVTNNNRDRDGHGPEFHKHMHRINQSAGTKITVYHSFHDEVRSYQQHWWQCQGPCRNRKPYFGMVRRAMNRAPGPSDFWWSEHQATCGGTYVKIREPEGYSAAKKGGKSNSGAKIKGKSVQIKKPVSNSSPALDKHKPIHSSSIPGIQKYFSPTKQESVAVGVRNIVKPSPVTFPKNFILNKQDSIVGGEKGPQTGNVPSKAPSSSAVTSFVPFSGEGRVLGSGPPKLASGEPSTKKPKLSFPILGNSSSSGASKVGKSGSEVECPVCGLYQLEALINEHLDECILRGEGKVEPSCSSTQDDGWRIECPGCRVKVNEEAFDDHLDECEAVRGTVAPPEEIDSILDGEENGFLDEKEKKRDCVCPACGKATAAHLIAQHLDACLSSMSFDEDM